MKGAKRLGSNDGKMTRRRPDRLLLSSRERIDEDALTPTDYWVKQGYGMRPASYATEEEWLAERARYSLLALRDCVEINPEKHGGVPVLRGTRFTVAQLFAEIGDGRSLPEIASDFGIDEGLMRKLMESFSIYLDRPLAT